MPAPRQARGQTALEYILLIAAAILFVIIVAAVGMGIVSTGGNSTQAEASGFNQSLGTLKLQDGSPCAVDGQCYNGTCANGLCGG